MDRPTVSRVLFVWISGTDAFQISCELIYDTFSRLGEVKEVLMLQQQYGIAKCLVGMSSQHQATAVKALLDNSGLLGEYCRMKICYSEHQHLHFKHQSSRLLVRNNDAKNTVETETTVQTERSISTVPHSRLHIGKSNTIASTVETRSANGDWSEHNSVAEGSCYSQTFHRLIDEFDSRSNYRLGTQRT